MTGARWQPEPDSVWLVHGTAGAVVSSVTLDGDPRTCVAIRLDARLNLDPRDVEDVRTYILDAPDWKKLFDRKFADWQCRDLVEKKLRAKAGRKSRYD